MHHRSLPKRQGRVTAAGTSCSGPRQAEAILQPTASTSSCGNLDEGGIPRGGVERPAHRSPPGPAGGGSLSAEAWRPAQTPRRSRPDYPPGGTQAGQVSGNPPSEHPQGYQHRPPVIGGRGGAGGIRGLDRGIKRRRSSAFAVSACSTRARAKPSAGKVVAISGGRRQN